MAMNGSLSGSNVGDMESLNATSGPATEVYWEDKVSWFLYAVPSIVLFIFGIIGNTLSFIVFSRKNMRQSVTSVYFRVLAISDSVVLMSGSPVFFIIGAFGVNIQTLSQFSCKFWVPVLLSSCYHSCWILVFIAVDRFIGVWAPHKYKKLCSQGRALAGMIILFFAVTLTVGVWWAVILELNADGTVCGVAEKYMHFFEGAFLWMDMTLLNFIPTIALVVLNIGIIIKISRAVRTRHSVIGRSNSTKKAPKSSNPTGILLAVSFVYVLCTIPTSTKFLATRAFGSGPHAAAQKVLYSRACETLYLFNHAVNFFLYCLTGSGFRKELKHMFHGAVSRTSIVGTQSTSLSVTPSFKGKYTKRDIQ